MKHAHVGDHISVFCTKRLVVSAQVSKFNVLNLHEYCKRSVLNGGANHQQ